MSEGIGRTRRSLVRGLIWGALVLIAAAVILLITTSSQGACYDSGTDPDASYCTSEPVVGVAGVWILWTLWALLAASLGYRVLRRRTP
jgi:Na+-driven multidrug efflux pump